MGLKTGVLALCCAWALAGAAQAAGDSDEAWIAAYMARADAPGAGTARAQDNEIGFAELDAWRGRRVRVALRDGRERRGIVEGVEGDIALLRTQLGSGFFRYGIARADVRGIRED